MKRLLSNPKNVYLITDRTLRKYFCGVDVAEGYLVVGKNVVCFTDARYFSAAKEKLRSVGVETKLYRGLESIREYLDSLKVTTLFIDYSTTTVKEYEEYKSFGLSVRDCENDLSESISVKTESEIGCIEKACDIAEKAYHTAIKSVKKGITEKQLKDRIERLMVEYGAEEVAFDTIVAFGKNAAVPHHETGDTVLTDDMVILVDMGCRINGYCSDLTRTAFFGNPTEKFLFCYNAVKTANAIAEEKIVSGMKTVHADKIAREYLNNMGLGEYFTHSLGHGIGLNVHEYPYLSPKRQSVLEDGNVFSIEPGVYIDGEFGIRIEDTVILQDGKVKRLFSDDKELLIIKK